MGRGSGFSERQGPVPLPCQKEHRLIRSRDVYVKSEPRVAKLNSPLYSNGG